MSAAKQLAGAGEKAQIERGIARDPEGAQGDLPDPGRGLIRVGRGPIGGYCAGTASHDHDDTALLERRERRPAHGPIIETVGLTKTYAGTDFRAVDGLNLRSERVRSSVCSGPTARARRRRSAC